MDEVDNPEVSSVVLIWPSQVAGKTETVNNIVGHKIDIDPCPILVIQPTLEMAETWSKDRLTPMLRDTPRLRNRVKDARSRDADNKILHKRFPGGHITMAGANSPASLASRPIRILLFDEVDRFPASAGTEGDPVSLAEKRTESFPDAVSIKVSTPTVKGASRIEEEFEKSDKRYWFVKHKKGPDGKACGHEFHFKWSQVEWNKDDITDAWINCPCCKGRIYDRERQEMVRAGKWKATAPFKGVRGYHLNAIYTLFRPQRGYKNRLHQLVAKFLEAKRGGPEKLKVFVNTVLAESWAEDFEDKPTWEALYKRVEVYGGEDDKNPIVPAGALVLIGSVDVQKDRLELEVQGLGMDEETWGIERRQIWGDPHKPATWKPLDDYLDKTYQHELGSQMRIAIMVIDSGDGKTSVPVYSFVKPRQARRVFAVKGSSTPNAPLIATAKLQKKSRVQVITVGTDTAKATLYARLNMQDPGPRYLHFPKGFGYDAEFFEQLTAESVRTEYKKGVPVRVWRKDRDRNEALDMRVYALAAVPILNPNMPKIKKQVEASAQKKAEEQKPKDYYLKDTEAPAEQQPTSTVKEISSKPKTQIIRGGPRRPGGWVGGWKK